MKTMTLNWRTIALIEALLILGLIGWHFSGEQFPSLKKEGLLSPRIYGGVLEPQSFLVINYAGLRKGLQKYFDSNNYNVSVYVVNLRDGASMGIDEEQHFPAASLNKVPMAIFMLREVERGTFSLDTPIPILEKDKDHYSGTLYSSNESSLPLHTLLEKMLVESDNTAYRAILRSINTSDTLEVTQYLDFYSGSMMEKYGEETPLISSKVMYNVFMSLYLSTILEPEHSEYILELLSRAVFDVKKLAKLPEDVTIAQKFGLDYSEGSPGYFHSCGIIYVGRMRSFYCVMTEGLSEENAQQVIGTVVNAIYQYATETRQRLDETFKVVD